MNLRVGGAGRWHLNQHLGSTTFNTLDLTLWQVRCYFARMARLRPSDRKPNVGTKRIKDATRDYLQNADSEPERSAPTELPEPTLNLDQFPFVPNEARPRKISFDFLPPVDVGALEKRGYKVVLLRALPRETARDKIEFLLAMLQGVTDGTVEMSKQRGEATFLEMKARGLFADRTGTLVLTAKQVGADVQAILDWDDSRHTLAGNTTIVPTEQIEELARGVLLGTGSSVTTLTGRPRTKAKKD